jgi:hypothetical protein
VPDGANGADESYSSQQKPDEPLSRLNAGSGTSDHKTNHPDKHCDKGAKSSHGHSE